jgi:hypothetical protein
MSFLDAYASGIAARRSRIAAGGLAVAASAPFSGQPQSAPNIPPPNYSADAPAPPPVAPTFDAKYHGHNFKAGVMTPVAIGGFDVDRMRAAIEMHDQGIFFESSTLAIASLRFGPVFAALGQRIAPSLALPIHVRHGAKGLARIIGEEITAQLAPSDGLSPSPYFPSTLWGSIAIDGAQMGFAVLQHVTGDEHPLTGIRPVWTRRWPIWATQYQPYRETYQALTQDGPVDILNDGKFTLVADTLMPHIDCAAIRAIGTEVMEGAEAKQARASYVRMYGNPKVVATMPPKIPVEGPEGRAFFNAAEDVRNQDGVILMANGGSVDFVQLAAETSTVFADTLANVWQYVAAIYLGSDGTMTVGNGVYSAPVFAGVRRDLIDRGLKREVRAVNQGHVKTYVYFNHTAGIETAKARGLWSDPVVDKPLPDPAADARIDSLAKRRKALAEQVQADRAAGAIVDQDHVDDIAADLEIKPFVLAKSDPKGGEIFEYHITEKIVSPDQVLARLNLPPLPGGIGSPAQLAKERAEGKDKTGANVADGSPPGRSHERGAAGEPAPADEPAKDQGDTAEALPDMADEEATEPAETDADPE